MTGPECPAEGCDYNEDGEKTAGSVRRHINAKTDGAHQDKNALRAALMGDSEGDDEPPGTGGAAASEGDEDDEQGEAVVEGAESSTEAESEHPDKGDETADETDMVTADEYEQQVQGDPADSTTSENSGSAPAEAGGGMPIPVVGEVSPLTLIAAVLILAVVAYLLLAGGDADSDDLGATEQDEEDMTADDTGGTDREEGGLL